MQVKIIRGNPIVPKVGDTVEFMIGDEAIRDKITYIDIAIIEGELYDLTHVKFRVIRTE